MMKRVFLAMVVVMVSGTICSGGDFYPFQSDAATERMRRQKAAQSWHKAQQMLGGRQQYEFREQTLTMRQQQIRANEIRLQRMSEGIDMGHPHPAGMPKQWRTGADE